MNGSFAFRSLQQRLFAGMLATTLLGLTIFAVTVIVYDLRDHRLRTQEDLATQAALIGIAVAPALQFDDPALAREGLRALRVRPQILKAAIYDTHDTLFATFFNQEAIGEDIDLPPLPGGENYRIEGTRIIFSQRIIENNEELGTLYIEARYQLWQRLQQSSAVITVVLLVALATATLVSLRMQRQVTRPLQGITAIARQVVEQRNFSLRADKISNDEIGYLVDAFNDLLREVETRRAALESSNLELQQQIHEREQATTALAASEQEIRALNADLENRVAVRTAELERANRELEAFSYSVSHDLRTPLRAIDGFSQAVLEDYGDQLDDVGQDYLQRVRAGAQRMGRLIDDLLKLARVSRAEINADVVDLSRLAGEIVSELRADDPSRKVAVNISTGLTAAGDPHLMRIVLENLLNNAWKYTGRMRNAEIEFGMRVDQGEPCFFVRDNGAGFDMVYAGKLFGAFQRLHDSKEYAGTGVGLATVQRIIHRHGGRIWAHAAVNEGATFYFTLPMTGEEHDAHKAHTVG